MNSMMITLAVIGLIIAAILPGIEKFSRKFFVSLFVILLILMIVMTIDTFIFQNPKMADAERILIFLEYFFIATLATIFTPYFLNICGEKFQKNLIFRAVIINFIIYFIFLVTNQFTEIFYYVTAENIFYRREIHPILLFPLNLIIFLNLYGVIKFRKKLQKKYFVAFLIFLIPIATTFSIHAFFYVEVTTFFGVVISTLAMFGIILYDQIEKYFEQQREIANQRANIMVLQMRPHFIYNAMMSIYYLCVKNPEKAQQVTLDFTTYLRKNFTAIASEETIPFEDELEHTRAYLAIEQVQFKDNLLVEYEIEHKNFKIPPLTLQPIVENAVKHGMDPENAPLKILIRTQKTDSGSEIIVENDGSDFSPDEDYKPNTALSNIRQRLEMMCGGKIKISPRADSGTVVKIFVPFE